MEVLHRYSNVSYLLTALQRVKKSSSGKRRAPATPRRQPHNIKYRLGTEVLEQIAEAYRAGESTLQLAAKHQVSSWAITAHLRNAGVPIRLQRVTAEQLAQAGELYATGMSLKAVGAELGFADSTIYHAFVAAGLPIRRRS